MTRIVLGLFSDQQDAAEVLQELRRRKYRRSAAIHKSQDGRVSIEQNGLSSTQSAVLAGGIFLVVGILTGLPAYYLIFVSLVGILVGALSRRWLALGLDKPLLARYSRWVLSDESLILAEVPAREMTRVVTVIRNRDSRPATFIVRPGQPFEQRLLDESQRREPLTTERLKLLAVRLASSHRTAPPSGRPQPLLRQLQENEIIINDVRLDLAEAARLEQSVTPAAEWLLDNAYIVEGHIADVRRNLPSRYHKILPVLTNGSKSAELRVYHLARELVIHTDARLQLSNIIDFLEAYQSVSALTIAELWVIPLMLRFVLIEELRQRAVHVSRRQHERELADFWANRLLNAARRDPDQLLHVLAELAREQPVLAPHFAVRLTGQLYDEETALFPVQRWLERKLDAPLQDVLWQEQGRQAADQVSIVNAIGSFRQLAQLDWRAVFEKTSKVEEALGKDPLHTYPRMDFSTRDRCRQAVEEIARYSGASELEVCRQAVKLAEGAVTKDGGRECHVGFYLIDKGRAVLESQVNCVLPLRLQALRGAHRHPTLLYLGAIGFFTGALLLLSLILAAHSGETSWLRLMLLGVLALFPASEFSIQLVHLLINLLLPPLVLPKMSYEEGIPEDCRTLVVVPMMLLTKDSVRGEVEKLEIRYLANPEANLHYALLSDFTDAPKRHMPEDPQLIETATVGIEQLNARYGRDRFFLFHRQRRWCPGEERWIGWERKRGKLEELNQFLNGKPVADGEDFLRVGEAARLRQVRFVITLDADTQLPHDTARKMVETLAHPLNRPRLCPDTRTVLDGYTIIQPRVSTSLPRAGATYFTHLFSDPTGTDPYTQAVSDVYQDLFAEGIYHGKAIYDVEAFHGILSDRFPSEWLLSHDLIEGAYVRVGLASDIELFEQFPANYQAYSKRQHRWIRGDWQISDWVLPRVPGAGKKREPNPLSIVNRWKIFDNLRRSLVAPASVALLVGCWFFSSSATAWSLLVGLTLLFPALSQLSMRLARAFGGGGWVWREQAREFLRTLVVAALLPHQAFVSLDAITRVWFRRLVSHRHLLEWESAQVAHWRATGQANELMLQMVMLCLFTAAVTRSLAQRNFSEWPQAVPFLALWLISPAVAAWMNGYKRRRRLHGLHERDRRFLRRLARQTWRYFDELVGPQTNWLPPDNSQESLRLEVAQRTSPTNIGLWLLSALAARDFGYLTPDQFIARSLATMQTLDKLERYEGHLLNWYDIQSLEPLRPPYLSTVDSGNLLASLWILEQGCRDVVSAPILGPGALHGLGDALAVVREMIPRDVRVPGAARDAVAALTRLFRTPPDSLEELVRRLRNASDPAGRLVRALREGNLPDHELAYWAQQVEQGVMAWTGIIDRYLDWVETLSDLPEDMLLPLGDQAVEARREALTRAPSLEALAAERLGPLAVLMRLRSQSERLPRTLVPVLEQVAEKMSKARWLAGETLAQAEELGGRVTRLSEGINLGFLYDSNRRLFTIGHVATGGARDSSYYDLLASEARLASYVAIARGDVPAEHWLALGRPFGASDGQRVLLSWNGSMFEYLMPLLFTRSFEDTLLDAACRQAVARQIEYGRHRGIPWGISESAFSALDSNQIYQYRAFGVPGLGLKRGLEEDLVVAPYASALALSVNPAAAAHNLKRLAGLGLLGGKGLYEAIDYTRQRRPEGERGVIIYCYMAHHQGMTLLAIDNALQQGVMQTRFHVDLRVRAAEPLLFERIPPRPPLFLSPGSDRPVIQRISSIQVPAVSRLTQETTIPRTHLLCNGSYALMVTNSGGGYSRWRDFDITRWRADTTRDAWGSFFYIRDQESGNTWSATYHPLDRAERRYSAVFNSDRVEFRRRDFEIETVTELVVSPEDDAEIRRLTFTNRSSRARHLEVTSYAEIALAAHAADRAHPGFNKLFIQTEFLPERAALIVWRRPRAPEEPAVWAAHVTAPAPSTPARAQYETDRASFLGRGRGVDNPAALHRDLSNQAGAVLDPIFSLRRRISLEPGQRLRVAFVTVAAETRDRVLQLVEKYSDLQAANRALEIAWTHAQLEFRYLGIQLEEAQRFQELAGHLLYPNAQLRPPAERLRRNALGQARIWAYGISGDLPILAVTVDDAHDLNLVREALLAHTYWRVRGLKTDLVILNREAGGYDQPLQHQLNKLIQAHTLHTGVDRPGGVFLRAVDRIPEEDLTLLLASARALLVAARGSLAQQLSRPAEVGELPPLLEVDQNIPEEPSPPLPFLELPYFNGLGGFTPDGREYAVYLGPKDWTPAPWINVIANPEFGALVSESGQGFAWYGNSQTNRLTPWSDDPVSNGTSEAVYLRDDESGIFWTLTAIPVRELDAYRARHGQGYTLFEHNSHAIEQEFVTFVPMDSEGGSPLRVQRLRLRNRSARRRRLSVFTYVEWTLGTEREDTQLHIITNWDAESRSLLARNAYHPDFGRRVAFAAICPGASSFTGDRTEFLGRNGSAVRPEALRRQHLSGRTGPGLDPCAALHGIVELEPGETAEIILLLGQGKDVEQVRSIVQRFQDSGNVEEALATTRAWWDHLLEAVQVQTPNLAVDFLLNRWLLYQTLSCRIWARSAFYQSGGAFGFRDQLQDVMALVYSAPDIARQHILRAAGRQFVEGDVQHWWHPPSGAGIRSRCSDDLLWLPYAAAHYVRTTGDLSILDVRVPFLEGRLLENNEQEIFLLPTPSLEDGSLFEHCWRAIEKGLTAGPHGLPLIGSGDWNDGMNRVGTEGRGESVWLAWFLIEVLQGFSELCDLHGDVTLAETCRRRSEELAKIIESQAWDGEWYRRAYFDDGTPLGSQTNQEARIDSLPQSWAVISGAARPDRVEQALRAVEEYLIREADKLILIYTPPFDHSPYHPGYIKGYPPGVRENGGQYTHAALWLILAYARRGQGNRAGELLRMMNPVERTRTPSDLARYKGEPYVMSADVYALDGQVGRCGWTWYTGSGGWMYRVWLEEVLGFKLSGDILIIDPCVPSEWAEYTLRYRYRSAWYEIVVENPDKVCRGVAWVELDGERLPESRIPLRDDGVRHAIRIRLGTKEHTQGNESQPSLRSDEITRSPS